MQKTIFKKFWQTKEGFSIRGGYSCIYMYKCDSSVYVCVNECVSVDNKKSVCVCVCVDGKFLGDNTQKKFKKERKKERKNLSLSL